MGEGIQQQQMNSFVQANEQAVVDVHSIYPKLKEIPKIFCFFIYYQPSPHTPSSTHLQKLSFLLKEEKSWSTDKQQLGKNVLLHFVDLSNQLEVEQSFFELKTQLLQTHKIKLIFYSQENQLLNLLAKAPFYELDLSHIPSALYSPDLHGDLSQHLGWRESENSDLSLRTSSDFELNVKKWISSPGQRIDMWSAVVSVHPEEGRILRFDKLTDSFLPLQEKELREYFISHLSMGHHAELALNYESRRKDHNRSVVNKLIFGVQSVKKFCCLGSPSLQASTGILSVLFRDDKGNSQQITKQLVKEGSKKGILSLLFSNIDKYMGMKLDGGRLNDGRLEMGVYQSSNEFRLVASTNGQVVVNLNAQEVYMSVNNSCLKLVHPRQLRISLWGKIRVLISKQSLEC